MILTANAYAPDGRLLQRGQVLPDDVDSDFARDIRECLVADDVHPLLRLPADTEDEIVAGWRKVHEHDPVADPLVIVAADRLRHAAAAGGMHRLARLRPFVDQLPPEDDVAIEGTSSRGRRGH